MTSDEQLEEDGKQEARECALSRLRDTKDLVDYTLSRHALYTERVKAAKPSVHKETVQENEDTVREDREFFDPKFQWAIMAEESVGKAGTENSNISNM
jgi:hypothetical protein